MKVKWAEPYTGPASAKAQKRTKETLAEDPGNEIKLHRLLLSPLQLKAIKSHYAITPPEQNGEAFLADSEADQAEADRILDSYGIDKSVRNGLSGKWKVQWSRHWANSDDVKRKVLFQCIRGMNFVERNQKKNQSGEAQKAPAVSSSNTGCLAHIEITVQATDDAEDTVLRICGIAEHAQACRALNERTRMPFGEVSGKAAN